MIHFGTEDVFQVQASPPASPRISAGPRVAASSVFSCGWYREPHDVRLRRRCRTNKFLGAFIRHTGIPERMHPGTG
jgi:hypothetical protein